MSRSVFPTLTHDPTLADYEAGPERLAMALSGLSGRLLDATWPGRPPGEWSIRQIAHHIVDGDDLWKTPIKIALGRSPADFTLDWYWGRPQTEWAADWAYARRDVALSLALFRANRAHIAELLRAVPGAWDRCVTIRWPDGRVEPVSAGEIVGMQAGHALGHVDDILQIRSEAGI